MLAREVKILSTKHKPAPRCRNSLRKEAACPRTASTILSDCEQVCCWLHSKSSDHEQSKRSQPRLLHRLFSVDRSVHNCIFNIKYCSNWTPGKMTKTAKRRLNFVHGGLHILRNAMLLWSCSRKVVRFPVTLSTTCILLLSFTELFFSS